MSLVCSGARQLAGQTSSQIAKTPKVLQLTLGARQLAGAQLLALQVLEARHLVALHSLGARQLAGLMQLPQPSAGERRLGPIERIFFEQR